MSDEHIEHNGSGYIDTTVDTVIKRDNIRRNREEEDLRYRKMNKEIKRILERNNYILDGPISLINTESGRKRRIY